MTKNSIKFTKKNAIFLLFCMSGILLLLLISIIPLGKEKNELVRQIPVLKKQLAQQQQLQEILLMLDKKLTKLPKSDLPAVKLTPLPFGKTGQLLTDLRSATKKSNMRLLSVYPQLQSKGVNWQQLTVRSELQGHYEDIRQFLFEFLTLPYVKSIDKIKITTDDDILDFKLTFTVMLS